jgi:TPR repeat protein
MDILESARTYHGKILLMNLQRAILLGLIIGLAAYFITDRWAPSRQENADAAAHEVTESPENTSGEVGEPSSETSASKPPKPPSIWEKEEEPNWKKAYQEALPWILKEAGDAGNSDAPMILGHFYMEGKAVTGDLVEAYKWYAIAAKRGDHEARKLKEALHARLTPEQLAEAETRLKQFGGGQRK